MSDINITVDSKEVVAAKRDISDLERSFSSAYKSAQVFMSAFARTEKIDAYARSLGNAAKANQEIINKNLGVSKSYKSAEESARSFTQVLENQALAAKKSTEAFNKRVGISGTSAMGSGAGFGAIESEIDRLSMKYNQIYASSKIYEKSLNELNQAHMLGVISTKQHEAAVESLNKEYQQFQTGAAVAGNRFSQYAAQAANKTNQWGVVTQQAGYQIGDFFVQVQSGTNWMVAFGQQATQLVGVLPLMTGAFGLSTTALIGLSAGLGIAIPLVTAVGAWFMRTGDAAEKSAKKIGSLIDKTRELRLENEKLRGLPVLPEEQKAELARQEALDAQILATQARINQEAARRVGLDSTIAVQGQIVVDSKAKQLALEEELANLEEQRKINAKILLGYQKEQVDNRQLLADREMELLQEQLDMAEAIRVSGQESEKVQRLEIEQTIAAERRRLEALIGADNQAQALIEPLIKAKRETLEAEYAATKWEDTLDRIGGFLDALSGKEISLTLAIGLRGIGADFLKNFGFYKDMGVGQPPELFGGTKGLAPSTTGRPAPRPSGFDVDMDGNGIFDYQEDTGGGRGGSGGGSSGPSPLERIQQEMDQTRELLGLTREEFTLREEIQRMEQSLGEDRSKYSDEFIRGLAQQNLALEEQMRLQEESWRKTDELANTIEQSMSDAFMSMAEGTVTVSDAFKTMARDIIKQLYDILVVQQIVGSWDNASGKGTGLTGLLMTGLGSLTGNSVGAGVPTTPTTMAAATSSSGGPSGGSYNVVNQFNVTGSDADSVRREIAKMVPQITEATKASIMDAKQRGGKMASVFR